MGSGAGLSCGFPAFPANGRDSPRERSLTVRARSNHYCPASRKWPCIGVRKSQAKAGFHPSGPRVKVWIPLPLDHHHFTTRSTGGALRIRAADAIRCPFLFRLFLSNNVSRSSVRSSVHHVMRAGLFSSLTSLAITRGPMYFLTWVNISQNSDKAYAEKRVHVQAFWSAPDP